MLATIASVDCKIRIITIKSRFIEMFQNSNYSSVHLSNVLNQYYVPEKIDKPELESYITLSSYGKGIKKREIKEGKTPVPFTGCRIKAGQFVSSRLHAKEGAFGLVPDELDGSVVSRDFPVFDIDIKQINPKYLLAAVSHESFYQQFLNDSFGSTTKRRIKEDIFLEYSIILPPLDKQNEYVSFLEHIERTETVFKKYLNLLDLLVKSRFIEMFEDNPESSNWCFSSLESICNGITDGSHNPPASGEKSNNLMISSKNIHDGTIDFEDSRYLTDEQFISENNRTKVQKDDLLMTIVGTIGRTAIVPDFENNVTFQRSVSVLHPKHELLNVTYLKESLDTIQPDLERLAHGSSQKGIYLNQVKAIQIKLPPIELQNQFADFVKQMNKSKFMSSMTATDSASLSEQGLV